MNTGYINKFKAILLATFSLFIIFYFILALRDDDLKDLDPIKMACALVAWVICTAVSLWLPSKFAKELGESKRADGCYVAGLLLAIVSSAVVAYIEIHSEYSALLPNAKTRIEFINFMILTVATVTGCALFSDSILGIPLSPVAETRVTGFKFALSLILLVPVSIFWKCADGELFALLIMIAALMIAAPGMVWGAKTTKSEFFRFGCYGVITLFGLVTPFLLLINNQNENWFNLFTKYFCVMFIAGTVSAFMVRLSEENKLA